MAEPVFQAVVFAKWAAAKVVVLMLLLLYAERVSGT
jgi:hypothetical protein